MKNKISTQNNQQRPWYRISDQVEGQPAEIYIYDVIVDYKWDEDETTAKGFVDDLKAIGADTPLDLHINSPGGSVFAGLAIYNAIRRHRATVDVYIDGLAASIASVVAMAGDHIIMPENALLMIHDPYSMAFGTADDLRKAAESLDKARESLLSAYIGKSGTDRDEIAAMMKDETWMTAAEAVDLGFADLIEDALPMAALAAAVGQFDLSRYRQAPPPANLSLNKEHQPAAAVIPAAPDRTGTACCAPTGGEIIMDLEKLKQEYPQLHDEIFNAGRLEGAKTERERIQAVEDQLIAGHEDLVAGLKYDGVTTGDQAAVKILAAEKAARAQVLDNLNNQETPPVPAAGSGDDNQPEARQQTVIAAMVAGSKRAAL